MKNSEFDYAIMKLKKPVEFNNFLPLSLACSECLKRNNKQNFLKIIGFPCAYPPDPQGNCVSFKDNFKSYDLYGKKINIYQYGLVRNGRIIPDFDSQFKIGYGISTLPGQSGSPVVL